MAQPRIPTVTLNTGHALPLLGLGTWPLSDAEAAEAVAAALGQGYRLVDTAACYGNEAGVGRGLAAAGIPRAELFVTTKLRGRDHVCAATKDALRRSLESLGLDHVDLFLIHWPLLRVDKYVDSYRAILDLVGEGLVRTAGVSNFMRRHLQRLIDETGVVPAVDQIQLSPALPRPAIRAYLADQAIATQAWSPLDLPEGVPEAPIVAALAALDVGEAAARDADTHEIF